MKQTFLSLYQANCHLLIPASSASQTNHPPPSVKYRPLSSGRWHQLASPPGSLPALHTLWGSHGHYCLPAFREDLQLLSDSEREELGRERLLRCTSWEWVPSLPGGAKMREWNVRNFIARLVNSERGMLLVGDSLTGQMADVLYSMLLLPIPGSEDNSYPAILPSAHYTTGTHVVIDHMNVTLHPFHPLYAELRAQFPHILEERFQEPIVQYMRHDLLLSYAELEPVFEQVGFTHAPFEYGPFASQFPWRVRLPNNPSRWDGEQDSVLVLNTGAHWSPARWGVPQAAYTEGYRAVVRHLLPELLGTPKLHLVYRGTASPHTNCYEHTAPVFPGLPVDPAHEYDWGWAHFPVLDQVWAEQLDEAAPEGKGSAGGRVDILDVREMSAQRPEDHVLGFDGKGDCLHWYGPTVPGTWAKMVWHIL